MARQLVFCPDFLLDLRHIQQLFFTCTIKKHSDSNSKIIDECKNNEKEVIEKILFVEFKIRPVVAERVEKYLENSSDGKYSIFNDNCVDCVQKVSRLTGLEGHSYDYFQKGELGYGLAAV